MERHVLEGFNCIYNFGILIHMVGKMKQVHAGKKRMRPRCNWVTDYPMR